MPTINIFYKVIYGYWCTKEAFEHCKDEAQICELIGLLRSWADRVRNYKKNQPLKPAETFKAPPKYSWTFNVEEESD